MQRSVKWCLGSHYHLSAASSYFTGKSLAPFLSEPETYGHMDVSRGRFSSALNDGYIEIFSLNMALACWKHAREM